MFGLVPVAPGQAEAHPFGDHERQNRTGQHRHPEEPGHRVEGHAEVIGDLVVGRRGPQQPVERDPGRADAGAGRGVARPVQEVPGGRVAGEPAVEQRVRGQQGEEGAGYQDPRHQHRERERVTRDAELPARHDPQRAVKEAQVPAGHRSGADAPRLVGPEQPDGIDLRERSEEREGRAGEPEHHHGNGRDRRLAASPSQ